MITFLVSLWQRVSLYLPPRLFCAIAYSLTPSLAPSSPCSLHSSSDFDRTLLAGNNIEKGPLVFVAVSSIVYLLMLVVVFGVLKKNTMGAGLAWAGVFFLIIAFQFGARSLIRLMTSANGKRPISIERIRVMANRTLILMAFFTVCCFGYVGVNLPNSRSPTIGLLGILFQIFIPTNILMAEMLVWLYVKQVRLPQNYCLDI